MLRVINTDICVSQLNLPKFIKGFNFGPDPPSEKLGKKIQDLYTAYDRKPSEESHGASYETQLTLELDLLVSLYLVVRRRVEENVDKLKGGAG